MTLLYHPSSPGGRRTPAGVFSGPRHLSKAQKAPLVRTSLLTTRSTPTGFWPSVPPLEVAA